MAPEQGSANVLLYSAIHKAAGLTVPGRSTGLPGIIPKISKESRHTECPPDPVLYGGRPSSGFVNLNMLSPDFPVFGCSILKDAPFFFL